MSKSITKKQIIQWLEERRDKFEGHAINAEERGDDEGFRRNDEKVDLINEMLDTINQL